MSIQENFGCVGWEVAIAVDGRARTPRRLRTIRAPRTKVPFVSGLIERSEWDRGQIDRSRASVIESAVPKSVASSPQ